MIDYSNICSEIVTAVNETGNFIRRECEVFDIKRTETKGLHDLVSYVDKGSEEILVERLSDILPEAGFITEEGTSAKKCSKDHWVVDPLDGTTNFVHGVPLFAISVGLMEDDDPVAGVVYEVSSRDTFTAWKNGGSWLNNKSIHVSDVSLLSDSLIATGFPYSDFSRLEDYMKCFTWFCKTTHGVRRFGSASVDLAWVACGRFEAFFEYGLNPWDVVAGALLVKEAGGHFCNFSGDRKDFSGKEIIAANSNVFEEFSDIINKFMAR